MAMPMVMIMMPAPSKRTLQQQSAFFFENGHQKNTTERRTESYTLIFVKKCSREQSAPSSLDSLEAIFVDNRLESFPNWLLLLLTGHVGILLLLVLILIT